MRVSEISPGEVVQCPCEGDYCTDPYCNWPDAYRGKHMTKLTADTITDEQIRELLEFGLPAQSFYARVALDERVLAKTRTGARRRCAEIFSVARPIRRCRSTGFSSARYGACEVCRRDRVPDVWIGTASGGSTHIFGCEACVRGEIALGKDSADAHR